MSCGDILWQCLGRKKALFGYRGIAVMTRCQGCEDECFFLLLLWSYLKMGDRVLIISLFGLGYGDLELMIFGETGLVVLIMVLME